MINTINHIPNSISIDKLKSYKKDNDIMKSFSHLEIPLIGDEEILDLDDNDTFICESDYVLFSTSNNKEESYLQFHVYDKEEDDFVIHHDIFVFSPINDAEYLYLNGDHYIALGTCEKDIMLYDSLVFNPMTPQILLKGHTDGILTVKNFESTLYSGSEDGTLIAWDLEKGVLKETKDLQMKAEKICMANGLIFCGENDSIQSVTGNLSFSVNGPLENMQGIDTSLYLTTSSGHFINYDVRNLEKPLFSHKYSDSALTGMHILNNKIGFCSKSGDITILDGLDFEIKNTEKIKSSLFSLKLHEDNMVFYGDETDSLNMKKLRANVF